MKRKLIISALVVFALLVCGVLYVVLPLRTASKLRARYEQVQRGMSIEEVETLMAQFGIRPEKSTGSVLMWDDERHPVIEGESVMSVLSYTVETFYLPISFEFTFDNQRRLVGRHISD